MKYLFTIAILVLTLACTKNEEEIFSLDIGNDWVDIKTKVYLIDTITVKLSTFQFDSINVSTTKRVMVGSYNDSEFGITKSKSYIQLKSDYDTFEIDDKAKYDSISLVLKYDKYFYNDTIPNQEFKVYKVLDDIEPDEDYFYNTTLIKSSAIPLAIKNFQPRPNKIDSLIINLDKTFGETLFNKIKDNQINNEDEFLDEYKGLLIEGNESNTSILGFTLDSELHIYYSIDNGIEFESENKILNFSFSATKIFNHIESDQEGTFFENIENSETLLPSFETNNNTFIQSGTGITTRIDIPYLETLYDIPGEGVILDTYLRISLEQSSDDLKILKTRDSLQLYIVNQKNEIIEELLDYGGNIVTGEIENNVSEFNITNYLFPIKPFIDLKLTAIKPEDLFLILIPKDFYSSVDRYIFEGEHATKDQKVKLEIIYTVYNEN